VVKPIYDHATMVLNTINKGIEQFMQPPTKKILPDLMLPPGYPAPKTLILNLDGTLTAKQY